MAKPPIEKLQSGERAADIENATYEGTSSEDRNSTQIAVNCEDLMERKSDSQVIEKKSRDITLAANMETESTAHVTGTAVPWVRLVRSEEEDVCIQNSVAAMDVVSFLRLLATNPIMKADDAGVVKKKIAFLREKRRQQVLAAFLNSTESDQKVKEDHALASGVSISDEAAAVSLRRSKRVLSSGRGKLPKVGRDHQVEVLLRALPEEDRTQDMVLVGSELVCSPVLCEGQDNIRQFLSSVNDDLRKRDGFPMSPFAEEIALNILVENEGDIDASHEKAMFSVGADRLVLGGGAMWTRQEEAKFVIALGEHSKAFSFIARRVLTDRSTAELVFRYYTNYKQQKLQGDLGSGAEIVDVGAKPAIEVPEHNTIDPVVSLRSLAQNAGDGFSPDRRMANAIVGYRRKLNS